MIYGYARVSTNEDRQDITRQTRELKALGVDVIYFEYASGTNTKREELKAMLENLKANDTIVALEISRLSRSTKHLLEIIEVIKEKRCKLIIKDSITIDCLEGTIDPMTNAFLQISGVFAELERNIISERIKSGIENRKCKGGTMGRNKTTYQDIPKKFIEVYELYKAKKINKSELSRLAQVTRPSTNKYIEIIENFNN